MIILKKILIIFLSLITLISCSIKKDKKEVEEEKERKYLIGISQIIAHPSLDKVVLGIKDVLKNENVDIQVMVANGELGTANLIASNFKKSKDIVIGVGTGTSQALKNNIDNKAIVFSAVTDPKSAGLISSNITGVSDMILDVKESLMLLKAKFPNIKSIGVLYSTSELNSAVQLENIEKIAKELNIKVIKGGATNANDLVQITNVLIEKVDVLYIPTDNLVVSNIKYVADVSINHKKPLVASDSSSVENGALFAKGVDYYELGKRTGEMVLDILKGKDVSQIPYEMMSKTKLYVNENTAKILEVNFSEEKE